MPPRSSPNETTFDGQEAGYSFSMNPLANSTTATDEIVDAVTSQAIDIAQDMVVPAAKFAAIRLIRNRAKTIVAVAVIAAVAVTLFKRKNSNETELTNDRPSSADGPDIDKSTEKV